MCAAEMLPRLALLCRTDLLSELEVDIVMVSSGVPSERVLLSVDEMP